MLQLLVASLVATALGVWLAMRKAPAAASWLAVGAGFSLALASRFPVAFGVPTNVFLAAAATAAAATWFVIAAELRRERRAWLEWQDAAQRDELLREARVLRLSRRTWAKRSGRWRWPARSTMP